MEISTIGFTKKTAAEFFGTLKRAGIRTLVDVRLNNVSQLAGFSKRDDLAYFLRAICDADYRHEHSLAPTQDMLDEYKRRKGSWAEYEERFVELIRERKIEETTDRVIFEKPAVLLCSEATPERCHRRLVAEYLQRAWGDVEIVHL